MKKLSLFGITAFLLMISCAENNNNNYLPANDFAQLRVGNYWIYEWYEIDTNGVRTQFHGIDSVYIPQDTIIDGNLFFLIKGTYFGTGGRAYSMLRDSNDYLFDEFGHIRFSTSNFTDTLLMDTIIRNDPNYYCYIVYQMKDKNLPITVPIGTYKTYNFHGDLYYTHPLYEWGRRDRDNYYARGIGAIKERAQYVAMPTNLERVLIRYNVQK